MTAHPRRLLGGLLAVGLLVPASIAMAQPNDGGSTAADALALSQLLFPDGATEVVIAREDDPIDSLTSGFLQGALGGPLLLTPTGDLSDAVEAEIERLGATGATVLGGEVAVTDGVVTELEGLGLTVNRYAGDTRFGTAEAVALGQPAAGTTAIVARAYPAEGNPSSVFADSIGAGALGAGIGAPVYLSDTADLTTATDLALEQSALSDLLVVGGVDAITDDVIIDLESRGFTVTRLGGDDRASTATAIATYAADAGAGVSRVVLVEGYAEDSWGAGFAAAAANGDGTTAVLLSDGESLPDATAAFLSAGTYEILCGPSATTTACEAAGDTQ